MHCAMIFSITFLLKYSPYHVIIHAFQQRRAGAATIYASFEFQEMMIITAASIGFRFILQSRHP